MHGLGMMTMIITIGHRVLTHCESTGYGVHSWSHDRLSPPEQPPDKPFAFIGVRSCELTATAIQDRVFLGGHRKDQHYESRRRLPCRFRSWLPW
jgi:hypothetical protein